MCFYCEHTGGLSDGGSQQMKVLHLIGGGDVGGAKTHVLSLVKKLGEHINVKIISFRPGMFSEEAAQLGIDIEVVKSGNIFKDIFHVVSIVKEGGYQIIHSHGAKANMIAIAVKARTGIATITTVHSDYQLDYMHSLYKRLTFGAINTIALRYIDNYIGVSNTFTEMLIERKFQPARIYTLYNGMDFDTAPKVYSRATFMDSYHFPISDDDIIVGIAARLYPVKGLETLLRAAENVKKQNPHVKFIIGGDGEDREHLESMRDRLGLTDTVFFTGWLSDPDILMSIVDISVLTSISESFPYSILEGARFSKATISTRVGGIPDLIRNNKDGLLLEPGDHQLLAEHILTMAADQDLRVALGKSLYERAKEKFSLKIMCQTQLDIYQHVYANSLSGRRKNSYDVIISGYYGFNNIGDDAMLTGIIENFKAARSGIRLVILSKTPVKTALAHRVNTFNRLNFLKTLQVMRRSKLFVYGGGNIIQDSTSTRSLLFYLFITLLAKFVNTKVMFFGNGLGPLIKPFNRRVSGKVLNYADVITVREQLSLKELESLQVTKPSISLTADPALLVTNIADAETVDLLFAKEGIPANQTYIGFSVRDYPVPGSNSEDYLLAIARAADQMAEQYDVVPVFIPMEHTRDIRQISKVLDLMKTKGYMVENTYSVRQILGVFSRMEMVVAMRLHALIFAANLGVPVVSIEYQPKIEGFIQYIGQPSAGKMETLKFENLFMIMDKVWQQRTEIREQLAVTMESLRKKAYQNVQIAVNLLEREDDKQHDDANKPVGDG